MAIRTGPVGYSFTALRILQCLALVPIIALCTCLAAEVNQLSVPRQPLPVAFCLSISVITFAYTFITFILHVCGPHGHSVDVLGDAMAAFGLAVSAMLVGAPLTHLDCSVVGATNSFISSLGDVYFSIDYNGGAGEAETFIQNVTSSFGGVGRVDGLRSVEGLPALGKTRAEVMHQMGDYRQWVGRVEGQCMAMKVVWVLGIVLTLLFAVTAALAFKLWRRKSHIKTFYVESVDGQEVYKTRLEPVVGGVMSEVSLVETEGEEGEGQMVGTGMITGDTGYRPVAGNDVV